jgi:hypothetical protein
MSEEKSSISQARTPEEIGEFWDTHDTADYWDQMEPAEFEIHLHSNRDFLPQTGCHPERSEGSSSPSPIQTSEEDASDTMTSL